MLAIGSPAPDLEFQDTTGRPVRLSDHRGHPVLLYFLRSSTCPVCNRHVRDLAANAARLADVRILLVVPEDRSTAAAWRARRDVGFPVLVGRGDHPHQRVGLGRRVFGSIQQSGTVLLDAAGAVRHVRAATVPTGGYDRAAILAAVDALRTDTTGAPGNAVC
ncbi:peroxiredoxin [Actinocatenispora thailandica]|uniref:thioredoxin-dependent peroxiredoxin n=1 Tax=Actinocatenispora thailandica TaxID=227318 RepID=A0A7R7HZV2_9ACTN|nr:peroxiredoxin family protein [Actinocatenispora thailandica]BCJ37418.1 peroxiredoxin [Actinocatenispora thailandica]